MNLKIRFKLSPLFKPANALFRVIKRAQWHLSGSPLPPLHEVKQHRLLRLRRRFGLSVFVETGTYRGKMVFAMRPYFGRIVSIELAEELAQRAQTLFSTCPEVTIVQGDSAERLVEVLADLDEPALFWLDGHYSGGETGHGRKSTPILEELEAIYGHDVADHVIAIDDALCFGKERDYPSLDELEQFVVASGKGRHLEVVDNMILINPAEDGSGKG
ncbi:O-methyltransferase [endosymbiont of unidentified scaly snail isolate Monju]|uniref:hypothetical protein n=1 Tax=endosymbiont of unidentified scaly snail isolate Monju TaxID=1248727 RepID=UPI0003891DDB|nr:hypothetical protein [endosymbiont of unidentified scaly snail isolate Monju]BAN69810.1 conserved hypothetical protein [endosymbiont of unidentified scaly snail isolate Monju]